MIFSLSREYVVPLVLNATSKLIVPSYFVYPAGAVSSTTVYLSVAAGSLISFPSATTNIPSFPVWAPFLSTAPVIVNTAGLSVITVEPSIFVLINLTVYFPEYVITFSSEKGFELYVFLTFIKFWFLPLTITSNVTVHPV